MLHCSAKVVLYDIEMTIGKRIKTARERLIPKVTQGALGGRLGVSDKAVSGWERGEALPEATKFPELRQILRVTYAWLIEGGSTPPPAVDDAEVLLEDRALNLYRKEGASEAAAKPAPNDAGRVRKRSGRAK